MSWDTIERTDHENGIVRISLDRPESHNSQSKQLLAELDEAVTDLEKENDVRVMILDGNGPSFSSGHALEMIKPDWEEEGGRTVEEQLAFEEEYFWEPFWNLREVKFPTIAQVHGYCGAAGLMLTNPCDIIMAAEDAEFANPVNRMASNALEILMEPWEVGIRKAKELLWTGDRITGEEAETLGMVNHAVPEDDLNAETMALATKISEMPPFATKMSKKTLNFTLDEMGQRQAYRHHFLVHQLTHASREWQEWHDEASDIATRDGIREFIRYRDDPFDIEAED